MGSVQVQVEFNILSETRVSEGLSCSCMRPSAIRVWGLKLFVCEAFSYYLEHVISPGCAYLKHARLYI